MTTYRRLLRRVLFGLLLVALPLSAWADGRIRGTVTDPSGAVVPGAVVRAVLVATRVVDFPTTALSRVVVADERGAFSLDGVPGGTYTVSAEATGFEMAVQSSVHLDPDGEALVTLRLAVGRQQAVVSVSAPPIATAAPGSGDRLRTSDTASLLDGTAGVSIAANGGVAGLPAIHGLADDRVRMSIDGMTLASACSTHMNPPLSYVSPASLAAIKVMAGITPVSAGGDSIGGSIIVDSPRPAFATSGIDVHADVSLYARSNSRTGGGSAAFSAATEHLRVSYIGSYVDAGNYRAGGGATVLSTFYTTASHALQVAATRGKHTLTGAVNVQRIPEQAFANARMDMTRNDSTLGSLAYETTLKAGRFDARGYYEKTAHEMNILRDKIPGMDMPMLTRGANLGYTLNLQKQVRGDMLRVGTELHRFELDDWWPAVMPMVGSMGPDTLLNINNGRRTRVGTHGEFEVRRGAWTTLAGLRSDIVAMNTDNVVGYNMSPTATGSAAYYADALEFNTRDHARRDYNLDATLMTRTAPTPAVSLEFGYARKTRSPNLYERYLWVKRSNMSVQMNGWFGDANGYVGNLDLAPEVAHTLSATLNLHGSGGRERELIVTPYVTRVNDYIDVDRCAVIAGSNGCTAAKLTATAGFVNLQFANHDARLAGFDVSGRLALAGASALGSFSLTGTASYVRGEILATNDPLYRLMPLDARLSLDHRRGAWGSAVMVQGVAAKDRVQAVRNELTTPGYVLVNLRTGYQFPLFRLDVGIDNLADRRFILPIGGRYWVGDKAGASGVPGMGRSFSVGVTAKL